MFNRCSSLKSLDLSNFDTSSVISMYKMFSGCSSLNSLNLSNFNTSNTKDMEKMFSECSKLTSLDLSNFNTSNVINMNNIFNGCSSLTFLDLSIFNVSLFSNCIFNNSKNLEYVNLKGAMIGQRSTFIEQCNDNPLNLTICSDYENFDIIFNSSKKENITCINNLTLSLFDISYNVNSIKCFKINDKELNNPCKICGNNYSKIINANISYINCYEHKEGYYFDNISLNYSTCYISCKRCDKNGSETQHNCIECKEEYNYVSNFLNYKNCFMNSSFIENRTELIQNMYTNIFNKLNISNIDNGEDKKIIEKNISIIMTSTKNQKKNENEKIVTINLGKCENILKDIYNISKNDSLYMLQIISEEKKKK